MRPLWALTHHYLAQSLEMLGRTDEVLDERLRAADLDNTNAEYQYEAALNESFPKQATDRLTY